MPLDPADDAPIAAPQVDELHLKQIVLSMPALYRDVFVLSRFGGMTYAEIAAARGLKRFAAPVPDSVPASGAYVPPTVVTGVDPRDPLAQDELFGPVLAVVDARDFDDALRIAMDTPYALTAGLYSRSPARVEQARAELRVGNLYINRPITGAIVGRHPFGGDRMSGGGTKAGGPDYLLSFVDPRHVSENTMRRGFTPQAPST